VPKPDFFADADITLIGGVWVRYRTKKRTAHLFLDPLAPDALREPALCGGHAGQQNESADWEIERFPNDDSAPLTAPCKACLRQARYLAHVAARSLT
jgi:hypothetical protein